MSELAHATGGKTMSAAVPEPESKQSASEILLVVVDGGDEAQSEQAEAPAAEERHPVQAQQPMMHIDEPEGLAPRGFVEAREIMIDDDGMDSRPLSAAERLELEQLRAEKAARERRELERLRAEHRRAKRRAQRRAELRAERAAALAEHQAYAESMDPSLDGTPRRQEAQPSRAHSVPPAPKGMPAPQRTMLVCNGIVVAIVLSMAVMGF